MRSTRPIASPSERNVRRFALVFTCVLAGLAIAGPSGLYAWRENAQLQQAREAQLVALTERRDMLRHRVALLDPDRADPDLVSELIRRNLNVVHPDEIIVELEPRTD